MQILDKNIETSKKIITSEVEKAGYKLINIILFGSMARGDYEKDSDYDFLVVVDKEVNGDEMLTLYSKISKKLSKYGIYCDVITHSKDKFNETKDNVAHIDYYALKNGKVIYGK